MAPMWHQNCGNWIPSHLKLAKLCDNLMELRQGKAKCSKNLMENEYIIRN
jgi:hypothetical protein